MPPTTNTVLTFPITAAGLPPVSPGLYLEQIVLGRGTQGIVLRVLQRLVEQRQCLGVLAVVVEGSGLGVGQALVGAVEGSAAVVAEVVEVSQGLRVVGRRQEAVAQQLIS